MSFLDNFSIDIPSFFTAKRGDKSGALSQEELDARRKIAIALASRRSAYPKTIGEGLSALGEGLADRWALQDYADAEAGSNRYNEGLRRSLLDPTQPSPSPVQPQPSAATPPVTPAPSNLPQTPPAMRNLAPQTPPVPGNVAEAAQTVPNIMKTAAIAPASQEVAPPRPASPMGMTGPGAMDINEWTQRIRRNESGGAKGDPYKLVGPVSRRGDYPYGAYQVMGENIPQWTRQHYGEELTPQQFLANSEAQDAVARGQGQDYINKYGPDGAARAWFAGPNGMNDPNRKDTLGTHVAEYSRRFNRPLPPSRDTIAASLAAQSTPSPMASDEGDARLADVTGVASAQPRVQLASLRNEPVSDAPPVGAVDAGITNSVAARRAAIADTVGGQQQTPPAPQRTAEAAQAAPPMQAAPQQIPKAPPAEAVTRPPADPNARPLDPGPEPVRPDIRTDPELARARAIALDPRANKATQAAAALQYNELLKEKEADYTRRYDLWKERTGKMNEWSLKQPEMAVDLATKQQSLRDAQEKAAFEQRLGGPGMLAFHQEQLKESAKSAKPAADALPAIANAKALVDKGMLTGVGANQQLTAQKVLSAMGFPLDPRVTPTEQFKSAIMPVVAAARQAQSGGANISDNDMKLAERAVAGDITLEEGTIKNVLNTLERLNLGIALHHQGKVTALAEAATGGDPKAMDTFMRLHGMNMESIVPKASINRLLSDPSKEAISEFNEAYKTPGLAERIIQRRK